ncbi:helix-turn-helix domain-containing protein [Mediannikoviicoccus vaginalis]|uniref:helix-turn-helix domain-containing protein n=1 Tax=Mediannikoviicoccus vaginalis TaxID=2899727 RepID=UPI001F2052CA|nr:helix-turn-helix transcriptional regulator [Mediannikoviicoccus vaginalis]
MILADKIIYLRKKNGWSQEELAEMLNVSRQSVSKWESSGATPELNRIIEMSKIFSVSVDYLIKDEIEEVEYTGDADYENDDIRVTMEDANEFINLRQEASKKISLGVSLLIISPSILIFLLGIVEGKKFLMSENMAITIGVISLIIVAAIAIALFIISGLSLEKYEFLEREYFETEYGVANMAKEMESRYQPEFVNRMVIGITLCIVSAIPVLVVGIKDNPDPFNLFSAVALLLFIVSLGVNLIVKSSIIKETYEQLQQTGDFTVESKSKNKVLGPIIGMLWLSIVIIYFYYSFKTNNWQYSWIIFPVGGLITTLISSLASVFKSK